MKTDIKILHLEDEESIVKVTEKLLTSQGFTVNSRQVQSREEFEQALSDEEFDLILADYSLPDFDGLTALSIAQQKKPSIPFILFSGSIGEEKAINSLRMGATDYVLKQNIAALVPTIIRALEEAWNRKEKEQAIQAAIDNEKKYRMLFEQAPDGIVLIDHKAHISECNPTVLQIMGYERNDLIGQPLINYFSENSKQLIQEYYPLLKNKGYLEFEGEMIHNNGGSIPIWCKARATYDQQEHYSGALLYIRDISELRHAQTLERILFNITAEGVKEGSMNEFLQAVEKELSKVIDTTNMFIGLYNPHTNSLSLPFMKDKNDHFKEVSISNTFSELVIRQKRSLLLRGNELQTFGKRENIKRKGTPAQCWLGVPLISDGEAFGILVVQSYSNPDAFDEEDVRLLEFIAGQIAGSIQRKQLEKKLIQLSRAVEQNPASIVITDLDGNIEYVNPRFTEVTGYSFEEVLGKNPRILKSGETPPEMYRELWKTITSGGVWKGRFHNKRKNGELFWEEAVIRPVFDENGKLINYIATKEDITKIKETEDAFNALFRQNEQLLDAISSILIVMDNKENVIRWNRAAEKIFAIPAEEAVGRVLLSIGIQWDWVKMTEAIETCRDTGRQVDLTDMRCTDSLGNEHFMNLHIVNYGGDAKEDSGFLILGEDITEWKLMQSQLIQAQKLESIGQMASGIAHEINTPIQYIGDNVRFLWDTFNDVKDLLAFFVEEPKQEQWTARYQELRQQANEVDLPYLMEDVPAAFEQTSEGIHRVAEIVRAMKEFTHPGQKEKVPVDINKALRNTILITKNEWKYVAEIETHMAEDLPTIFGFLGELNQVFLNIIVNAAHAVKEVVKDGEKGKIIIRTYKKEDAIMIEISDTGCGIPKENLNKIFDPFFTTKEVGKGTGQGLTIAYAAITKKHGGKIWCQSEVNKGTTFFIELPTER